MTLTEKYSYDEMNKQKAAAFDKQNADVRDRTIAEEARALGMVEAGKQFAAMGNGYGGGLAGTLQADNEMDRYIDQIMNELGPQEAEQAVTELVKRGGMTMDQGNMVLEAKGRQVADMMVEQDAMNYRQAEQGNINPPARSALLP